MYGIIKVIDAFPRKRAEYSDKGKFDDIRTQHLDTLNGAINRYRGHSDEAFKQYELPKHHEEEVLQ